MSELLDDLDDWAERHEANVMLTRRYDLTAPEEWSCVLTWEEDGALRQAKGTGMSPALAIERSLAHADAGVPA